MATDYPGNPVYPLTITTPDDGDQDPAASVSVGLQQLADRTAYLNAIISGMTPEFTDAIFHGTTTFADGSIVAPALTSVAIGTTGAIALTAGGGITLGSLVSFLEGALFSGDVAFGGGVVTFQDVATIQAPVTSELHGRIKKRVATLPEAAHTISIEEADIFVVPTLSAGQAYPLSDAGAEEGDTLRVNAWQNTTPFEAQITYGARTWNLRNQTGNAFALEFLFTDGGWIVNDGVMFNSGFNG